MAGTMSLHRCLLAPLGALALGAEEQGAHREHAQAAARPLAEGPKLALAGAQAKLPELRVGETDAGDTHQELYYSSESNALESLCQEAYREWLVELYTTDGA